MTKNNIPLSEYPRPQLERKSYLCLNGEWDYAFSSLPEFPNKYDEKILVPFSPESKLSGVNKTLQPGEYLFYKRVLNLKNFEIKDKVLLHFLAVDQIAEVYINKKLVGSHVGGFLPFEFDIKSFLISGDNELVVKVQDFTTKSFHATGKQSLTPEGIFYPCQSGIYLPVWIESVSNDYIKNIKITPDVDNSGVIIRVISDAKEAKLLIENEELKVKTNEDVFVKINNPKLWSPEEPYLYYFVAETKGDKVTSYFALRKVSLIDNGGKKVIALNNKPYLMKGVLDQGYYKDGLLTPTCDQDYINDIHLTKYLGFNTSRKHIKIESPRWYHFCDLMGLIVWQDFVNACTKFNFWVNQVPLFVPYKFSDHNYKAFGRENEQGRKESLKEFKETMEYLYNVPSICVWTIFNEGWGQFDSKEIFEELKEIDKTRLFDHASGWHDQNSGHFYSKHVYLKKIKVPKSKRMEKRAYIVSECGAFILDEDEGKKNKKGLAYNVITDAKEFEKRYTSFIKNEIIPAFHNGMSAFIYTQLSDVETEKNGFISYDRKRVKCNALVIKKANESIK